MAHSLADRQRVFLAYRTVFTGSQAHIRRSKKIEHHRNSFKQLITEVGFDNVVDIVKVLLDQCIFESELNAKNAFPELFQTSPTRDVQRNESEDKAARSEDKAARSAAGVSEELASAREHAELDDNHKNDTHKNDNHKDDKFRKSKLPLILAITTREYSDHLNEY
ncbi:ubiquinol-cytochrome-c reductase cytochrome c1 protein [Rutstroemia sp. NJR-2017a BBW]|nr:ubiquinol-cytochrome-c reductase cytochrome c1 protein [Rutstroemia sp. NJR-2017a BBW]